MEDCCVTFTAVEVDFDYEFDAVRYFDLSREESVDEAREAESWFDSAGSYPPSPFATKLGLTKNIMLDNVNTSPKSIQLGLPDSDFDMELGPGTSAMDVSNRDCEEMDRGIPTDLRSFNVQKFQNVPNFLPTGLKFYDHMTNDNPKQNMKASFKPSFSRPSTLMTPTASQLAKQYRPRQVDPRSRKLEKHEKSSKNSSVIESQAAKRQKLDEGHLCKVTDTNQLANLVHKAPKRHGALDGDSAHAKLRLTIPREPELETAQRAHRMRPKTNKEHQHVESTPRTFRALPLNRKILEAPLLLLSKRSTPRLPEFQEFHLKTSERAMQHTSTVSSSSVHCNDSKVLHNTSALSTADSGKREYRRPNPVDTSKQEKCDAMRNFKALPLNKKIFSSKGDIGVFRNSKRENTVPMEFNFHTEKRGKHDPPVELFNKLSLASQPQPNAGSQLKFPRRTCALPKGSKENRLGSFQQESEIKHLVRGKPLRSGVKQNQCGTDGGITEAGPLSRTSGIR